MSYQYVFPEERTRPAIDLLSRIPKFWPERAVDLGCGPGIATALIARNFPHAEIVGVDQDEEALQIARALLPGIRFDHLDIGRWAPIKPYDLIFSNGALKSIPNHRRLLPKLLSTVKTGGYIALQIPNNLQEPNRALMRMVAADGSWAKKLVPIAKSRPYIEASEDIYTMLRPLCASIDLWETTYIHPLNGVGAIIEWMKATGLGQFLTLIDDAEQQKFLDLYAAELSRAYPAQPDGTVLLRIPRLFILAQR